MKVSFDFDHTLSRKDVQTFAKELVNEGHEVWIVTSRFSDEAAKEKKWHWIEGQIPVFNFVCWFGVSLILQWIYQRMKLTELNKVAESLFLMMFIFFTLLTF